MKIIIDTTRDSKEDIRKVIEAVLLLQDDVFSSPTPKDAAAKESKKEDMRIIPY